ncbi:hypothetical protein NUU61_003177 [Penicillium alfredii]|uniref:Uncharacterized protein n=1 Tax=Penicillium alfredii TaxID=1506179 RepID=A0A9W9FTK6_9EURO|nr:uncharacterized protein NUU61_003177 [Penicillium alfredii]KAJ5105830.1 hypothetical protein NUU61_003177 [Penicillium alfredii]
MHLVSFLLPFLLQLHLQSVASPISKHLERGSRLSLCSDEDDIAETNDAPTGNNPPGIGVEFETATITLKSEDCSEKNVLAAKSKTINGRKGKNWALTADILSEGTLDAEYVLDGKSIKLNSGSAKEAAEAVAKDINDWDPHEDGKEVTIDNNPCTWKISGPKEKKGGHSYTWAPQVTAPLPLAGLYDLLGKYVAKTHSALLPNRRQKPMIHVTKDFFQSKPNGLDSGSVEDDVLGFFSLIMSFAKASSANPNEPIEEDESLKELTVIMPRTDFTSIYHSVKSSIPGDLYPIVKTLACYKNNGDDVELDTDFCSGTVEDPSPNGNMDKQRFAVFPAGGDYEEVKVEKWIKSMQNGPAPDALTKLDKKMDSAIGGVGDSMENILGSDTLVPLFEFRRLRRTKTDDLPAFVSEAEEEIVKYHKSAK